jgi:hypothetical protein
MASNAARGRAHPRMIPVYQRHIGEFGKGDCAWAALASLFEEPLESFHYDMLEAPSNEDERKLTECRWPHLEYHFRDLALNLRLEECYGAGGERWHYDYPETWEPPVPGFWIASIESQSLKRPVTDPYYPMPALHAVVMHGRDLAHDPNPNNEFRLTPMVGQSWWTKR